MGEQEVTETRLLPCPFCGGEPHLFEGYWVECTKCGCQTPETFEEVVISAWNRRTPHAAVPDGWQPIETAPKDGTRFWGKVGDDAIAMLWHDKFNAFVSSWRCMQMAPGYQMTEHHHSPTIEYPTHWMPLPAAPTEDE